MSSWRRRTVPLEERKEEISFFRSREENDVFCAVTELPEKYRMVVYLYYFEEVSTDGIAEIMTQWNGENAAYKGKRNVERKAERRIFL